MGRHLLQMIALCLIAIGATAFAQDRAVPIAREQVMLSYAPVVKKVSPAVVNIYTRRVVTKRVSPFTNDPFFNNFFGNNFGGLNREQVESSLGSGLIVDADGVVITNAHVVDGAQEVSIGLADGREFDAKIALIDKRSDLAVLRVETDDERLPYATLQPSDMLEVGDIVLAMGNPFGVGQTVTSGIVSALARSSLNINDFNFFIQTDAAINPGNSGGPLVSMTGHVVGLNTAIFSRDGGSLGIGFAIPSEMVATVIAAEAAGATTAEGVVRPWMGITGQTVTADIADSLQLNRPQGVLISKLHKSSPALKEGLAVGDVVVAINDKPVHDPGEMKFRLATVPIGKEAKLDYLRKGKEGKITVKTMAPPDDPPRDEKILEGLHPLNGAKVANINPAVAVQLGIEVDREGVIVLDVAQGSRASHLVNPGDIISEVNNEEVAAVKDLEKALDRASRTGIFNLIRERNGRRSQIVIR